MKENQHTLISKLHELIYKQCINVLEVNHIDFSKELFEHIALIEKEIKKGKKAKKVCFEAYQVVGSLLNDLNAFETEEAQKILDNLSQKKKVHKDVLPWKPIKTTNKTFPQVQRGHAVNIASNVIEGKVCNKTISPKGLAILCRSILEMDNAIKNFIDDE